jgi:hypothetical protein
MVSSPGTLINLHYLLFHLLLSPNLQKTNCYVNTTLEQLVIISMVSELKGKFAQNITGLI